RHSHRLRHNNPLRVGPIDVHAETLAVEAHVRLAMAAPIAPPAREDRPQHDAIADPDARHARSDLVDDTRRLVAHDDADPPAPGGAAEAVDVRPADAGRADRDADLPCRRPRVGAILQGHGARVPEDERLHRAGRSAATTGSRAAGSDGVDRAGAASAVRRRRAASSAVRSRWVSARSSYPTMNLRTVASSSGGKKWAW